MLSYEGSVVAYLRQNRTGTRRDLARFLGCSTVKAGQTVDSLLERRFLLQKPKLTDTRGRREGLLSLSDDILLPVLDMSKNAFILRLFTLSGRCAAERPYLHNSYFTREENIAAFIRTAALYLTRHLPDDSTRSAAVLLPFAYHEKSFADYCSEDFIREQLAARMPGWTTLLCTDAEAGAAALADRLMPRPDALIAFRGDRCFAAFPDNRAPIDLSGYADNGKSLAEIAETGDEEALAAFFSRAALFLGCESFLVDWQTNRAAAMPSVKQPLLCLTPDGFPFYSFGASLLLIQKRITAVFHSKGD